MAQTREQQFFQGPEFEVMPDGIPRQSVDDIILNYLDWDFTVELSPMGNNFTFFGKNIPRLAIAARYLLWGLPHHVESLVKIDPSILSGVVKMKDPLGRKIEGTLLQLAAMAGDFNIKKKREDDREYKDYGTVERLACYLPQEEAKRQLQAVFPEGWEDITNKRMQRYEKALVDFAKEILALTIPINATLKSLQDNECKPIIEKFRSAIMTPKADEVITSGYIFDLRFFYTVADVVFHGNFSPHNPTLKSDLFCVIGYGSLQAVVSAADAQVFAFGIDNVLKNRIIPKRGLLSFPDGSSYFQPGTSSRVGANIYFDANGASSYGPRPDIWPNGMQCWSYVGIGGLANALYGAKREAFADLMQRLDKQEQMGCVML